MAPAKRLEAKARDTRDASGASSDPFIDVFGDTEKKARPKPTSQPSGSYPTAAARQTAAHKAASAGNVDALKAAQASGESLNATDSDGTTPLHLAAYKGQKATVDFLLAQEGILKDPADKRGMTPLMLAAGAGHAEVVRSLLKAGEDPKRTAADGATALHRAAAQGNLEVVGLLLEAGADPALTDSRGKTAAALAGEKRKGDWSAVVSRLNTKP